MKGMHFVPPRYHMGVDNVVRIDRAYVVAAAAARDFNDELTVIMSSLDGAVSWLEEGHPAWAFLEEAQSAAQRCVWKAAGLTEYSARRGVGPTAIRLEQLLAG